MAESTWSQMGQSQRDTWKCKVCRNKSGTTEVIGKMNEVFLSKMEETIREQFASYL